MGYTYRHIDEDGNMGLWEYSNLALDILIQYKKLYPQVCRPPPQPLVFPPFSVPLFSNSQEAPNKLG